MAASEQGKVDVVQCGLDQNIDLHVKNNETALMMA